MKKIKQKILTPHVMGRSFALREHSSSETDLEGLEQQTNSSSHEILQLLIVTPTTPNSGLPSPDYTFIAKDLRAIVKGIDHLGRAPEGEHEPYVFSPEDLVQLIAHKKRTRPIDAHVVVGDIEHFIAQLHQDRLLSRGSFPRRIQVAFKRAGLDEYGEEYGHWTAIDILLNEDCMNVFYLDSVGDPRNLNIVISAVMSCPNTELTLCEDIEIDGKSLSLQKDGESCSIFTIDHIFHMSKLDNLHQLIEQYRVKEVGDKEIYCLDPRNLPPVLARNSQSTGFLKSWVEKNHDRIHDVVDKKGHAMLDYVQSHCVFYPPIKKYINAGIQHKQIQYTARLEQLKSL